MARHRANVLAALGSSTTHAGNMVSAINAFSAVFNVALTLLAQSYTVQDKNYMQVTGSILSNYSQAGLVLGIVMVMVFSANTMISCLDTSREFLKFCHESKEVRIKDKLPFPHSHIKALKVLTKFGTITSMRMVISPMINTLAVPMIGGFFLGTKGLLFVISGSNVLILCLSIFLINAGQSWVNARKLVLFGLLKDTDGNPLGPESHHYANLGIGEQIGGPFSDTTGPALNNFIKFVAVMAFVTGGPGSMYSETPENTFFYGFMTVAGSLSLVFLSKVGLRIVLRTIKILMERRRKEKAYEEGDVAINEEEEEDEFDL
jgi:Na+/H+-translocating membrane pyrophosphatase